VSPLSHDNDVNKSSATSDGIDADTGYRKGDQPEKCESNSSGSSDRDHALPPKPELLNEGASTDPGTEAGDGVPTIFPGILTQIGTPDHEGWMRKKGGYYSTWKKRYFVLKGTHLYWLRSNSVFVSVPLPGWCVLSLIVSDLTGDQGRGSCQYHRLSHHPRCEHQSWEIWIQVGTRIESGPLPQFR